MRGYKSPASSFYYKNNTCKLYLSRTVSQERGVDLKNMSPFRGHRQINRVKRAILGRSPRASKEACLRDHALFVFGINLALQIGDILSLCVGDVLMGRGGRIRIESDIRVSEGKTGNVRNVPLVDKSREVLKEYLRYRRKRFTPTFVGNTGSSGGRHGVSAVHPHVCGEHQIEHVTTCLCFGSSPRVWGTPFAGHLRLEVSRFIPTCVGNTASPSTRRTHPAVHPHVCGEHLLF